MPFQVIFSTFSKPPGVITYFTAGNDQTALCTSGITITATVVGDLAGHTTLWEQIAGDPVTFVTPVVDELSVDFTATVFDDKKFRFWIDKGTPFQQFSDVTVFGTPTAKQYFGALPDRNCLANYGASLYARAPQLKLVTNFLLTPQAEALAGCQSTNYSLVWEPINLPQIVQYVVQEKLVTGPWIDKAIIPADGATTYSPLALDAGYRVVAVYLDYHNITSVPSSPVTTDPNPGRPGLIKASVSDTHCYGGDAATAEHALIPTYTVLVRSKIIQIPPDEQHYYGGRAATPDYALIPTYSVLVRTRIVKDDIPPDQHYYGGRAATPDYALIPTYTVLDLTAGGIGGGG